MRLGLLTVAALCISHDSRFDPQVAKKYFEVAKSHGDECNRFSQQAGDEWGQLSLIGALNPTMVADNKSIIESRSLYLPLLLD